MMVYDAEVRATTSGARRLLSRRAPGGCTISEGLIAVSTDGCGN